MTFRAFRSLRVIGMHGKSCREEAVNKHKKFADKIKDFSKSKLGVGHRINFPIKLRTWGIQKCIRGVCLCVLERSLLTHIFFMTPKFWLSLEFCALARPGQSIMNSESVDRQVSSILDSESFNRLGLSVAAIQKWRFFEKMLRFREKVEISWESRDFDGKVEISWKS